MVKMKVIEHVQTEWASLILFAPKKDGSLRFCFNYRKFNSAKVGYWYPIPRMDE